MNSAGRKKNLIIVGASGFVGSHVASRLCAEYTISKTSRNDREGFLKFDIATDTVASLVDRSGLQNMDVTVVLCNKFGPMETYLDDQVFARECEVHSVGKMAKECAELNVSIVYLSTSYVFSGARVGCVEDSETDPVNLYGKLKREAELEILNHGTNNLILRLDKVVGSELKDNHLFSEWYHAAVKNRDIYCIKEQFFSPTYVNDIALAIQLCIEQDLTGIYHCVNPEIWQRSVLAAEFLCRTGLKTRVKEKKLSDLGLKEARPKCSNINSDKLINTLGIQFTPMSRVIEKSKIYMENVRNE